MKRDTLSGPEKSLLANVEVFLDFRLQDVPINSMVFLYTFVQWCCQKFEFQIFIEFLIKIHIQMQKRCIQI